MNRYQLVEQVRDILAKAGFYLSERHNERGISFDIIARKDDFLLVISVLVNADSSRIESAKEMKILSDAIDGSPMFISLKGGRKKLEKGVIYSRRGIPLLTPDTLSDLFLEGVPPYVFSAPGGFYVSIDSELLREARKERRISLGRLADIAGVSRKAIQKYEDGMGVDLDVALKIEEYFGEDLILPLNPLEYDGELEDQDECIGEFSGFQKIIFDSLLSMGYDITPTARCPFEAVTSDENTVLLSGVGAKGDSRLKKKAHIVSNISSITEKDGVIFLREKYSTVNIEGTPIINKEELLYLDSKDGIIELLKERSKEN